MITHNMPMKTQIMKLVQLYAQVILAEMMANANLYRIQIINAIASMDIGKNLFF